MYTAGERIVPRDIEEEIKDSYLSYAMSVIVGRALPDARDGLKPVHRRILYAMKDLGLEHNKPYKKCARIVGEILGKYHPHGDIAVYDTLVRLAQDFSMRYPLVDGQGNFGSVDGDSPAAMRYCVTGDTLVVTDKGVMPIEDISDTNSEDIRISVLSRDRNVSTAVKWFDSGEHPTIQITTGRGLSLRGSYNHPILTWMTDADNGQPTFRWKLLSQLRIGDVAVIDRTSELLWPDASAPLAPYLPRLGARRVAVKIVPEELTEDIASLLGALVAEGTVHEHEIAFCNSDAQWMEEFDQRWQRTFPDCRLHRFTRKPSSYGKKPYYTREIHSRYVVTFLRNIGLAPVRSRHKTIPPPVLQSPRPVVAAFLRAYFEGDGSISVSQKMTELSCISMSETLIAQIQTVLLRFGIASTKRFDRYRNTHKLYIRGVENERLFQEHIGFISQRKNERLAQAIARRHKESSLTDFVPFVSRFVRSHADRQLPWRSDRDFVLKHNFDRDTNLEQHAVRVVATVEPQLQTKVTRLVDRLLETHYLFDPIVAIMESGAARVYSLKVDSPCHSFVGNGFVNHNTEARLDQIAEELLADLEKDTVDFGPNFDDSLQEPKLLPAAVPQLLINGSSGIAVGMATNIPPHNLREIITGLLALIDAPATDVKELMRLIKGPDFPTGGIICGRSGIRDAFTTGRGSLKIRAQAHVEEQKGGKEAIVVTEIPYQTNKATLIETMAGLVRDKRIEGISDLRDESDKEGMRIVVELKRDAVAQIVLNQLFKHTQMETTFGVIMLALVHGRPKVCTLKELLEVFIDHRRDVIRRRTQYDLTKAQERAHILEGYKLAIKHLDAIIKLIRQSKSPAEAKAGLIEQFKFSERQAQAILELQLQRLTALERDKIDEEYLQLIKDIERYQSILASATKLMGVVRDELLKIQEQYGDDRRTQIVAEVEDIDIEDLIAEEDVVITISHAGYIKRLPVSAYRKQRRGGVGVTAMETREEDFVEHVFVASTHDQLLFFTTIGKVYWIKVHEIPQASRQAKGKAIVNLLAISQHERISTFVTVQAFVPDRYLIMATRQGVVKRTKLDAYANPRKAGIIAITLDQGDELIEVSQTAEADEIVLATQLGKAIRFPVQQVREIGRSGRGVKGLTLAAKDKVIAMEVMRPKTTLLTVTSLGYGKRTELDAYRGQNRGGSGVTNIRVTDKNGVVVGAKTVTDQDELMLVTQEGMTVRCAVKDIRETGRIAQGVRLIALKGKDRVTSMARVPIEAEVEEPIPAEQKTGETGGKK